jgi:type IV secretion system protein VirB5
LPRLLRRHKAAPERSLAPHPGVWSVDGARAEFFHAFGDLSRQRALLVKLLALLGVLDVVLLAAYIQLATTSRITPYIVLTDRYGSVQAVGPVPAIADVPDRITVHALSDFISSARSVSSDPLAIADAITRAYRYIPGGSEKSRAFLDTYYRSGHDPRLLSRDLKRSVQIASVLRLPRASGLGAAVSSTSTWRIRWYETTWPTSSTPPPTTDTWEAYATVSLNPPTSVERIRVNPLGVFLTDLSWSATNPKQES